MGHFKISSISEINKMNLQDRVEESDYAITTTDGKFIQFEYIEEEKEIENYEVIPGIYAIQDMGNRLELVKTSFVKDEILDSFVHTQNIEDKINCFFNKFDVYKQFGIEVPKRNILLYGPPGTGKSTAISKIVSKYSTDGKTAVVVFHTDTIDASDVKSFFKRFKYQNVEKVILVMEDIGGTEIDQTRMRSDSSLLALLDNQEKSFKIPTLIISTTNFPEVFLGNLTNRPGRFDDKIEVGYPNPEYRAKLLEFFTKNSASEEAKKLITSKSTNEFSPAHIRECVIRSAIYDKTLEDVIKEMVAEIEHYKNAFQKRSKLGLSDY